MTTLARLCRATTSELLRPLHPWRLVNTFSVTKKEPPPTEIVEELTWPRKIFSGIQPTGGLHIGNYFGAVRQWLDLQNAGEDTTFCIVDLHSMTTQKDASMLREDIYEMAATLFACGIDPEKSTVFLQSAVKEHCELCWILNCQSTMARLRHLPQYKEKVGSTAVTLGLFAYPVLQSADVLLYKATHVPVGEDQMQNIQLAKYLAKTFNNCYGTTFPICEETIDNKSAGRIRSLRSPAKKMSKSDTDPNAVIYVNDEPYIIVEKIKKALTDFTSDVTYDPINRPGVSNLISIYSVVTGESISKICYDANTIDTGTFKLRVADALVAFLTPIRKKTREYLCDYGELVRLLDNGGDEARKIARKTMAEVREKVGFIGRDTDLIPVKNEESAPVRQPSENAENLTLSKLDSNADRILPMKLKSSESVVENLVLLEEIKDDDDDDDKSFKEKEIMKGKMAEHGENPEIGEKLNQN